MAKKKPYEVVPIAKIEPPQRASRLEIEPEKVRELAQNIAEVGLINPLLVRPHGGRYEVVAGHRRYLAMQRLGRETVPCIVKVMTDLECALARASENRDREDLSPVEEAAEYDELINEHGLTVDEVAKRMGKSVGVVKRRLDILRMFPQLQKAIHDNKIVVGVAEELQRLGDPGAVDYYLGYAVDHGITVAIARQWVNDHKKSQRGTASDVGGGGRVASPLEDKPVYVSCDTCHGAEDLRKIVVLRTCQVCARSIHNAMQQSEQ